MRSILAGYVLFQVIAVIALAVIAVLSFFFWDKRYGSRKRNREIPDGYVPTEEVSIDPTTGKKERVYYKPQTGDRLYIEEK
jgi:hypothetical protein